MDVVARDQTFSHCLCCTLDNWLPLFCLVFLGEINYQCVDEYLFCPVQQINRQTDNGSNASVVCIVQEYICIGKRRKMPMIKSQFNQLCQRFSEFHYHHPGPVLHAMVQPSHYIKSSEKSDNYTLTRLTWY